MKADMVFIIKYKIELLFIKLMKNKKAVYIIKLIHRGLVYEN